MAVIQGGDHIHRICSKLCFHEPRHERIASPEVFDL